MANVNKVILIGNLTRDPELRYTPGGAAVSDIALAVNRNWNNNQGERQVETTFVDVTLWARQAEIAKEYLSKGSPIYIEGRLQLDSWEDKQSGQKRSRLRVIGESMQMLGSGGGAGNQNNQGGGDYSSKPVQPKSQSTPAPAAPDIAIEEDDDIPF